MWRKQLTRTLRDLLAIGFGCFFYAFGLVAVNIKNHLAEGGITGITLILRYWFHIDPAYSTIFLNIPLIILGYKFLGKRALAYTIYGTGMLSAGLWVWQRLAFADPELVRAASAVLALPQNQPLAAKLLWETADVIWSGLGDSSRDVNWYSKRATLSAVYAASVLYWLGDTSEGRKDTRDFIDRRIDGVMQFEKFKASARKIPGVSMLTDLALGWVRAPKSADEKEKA